MPLPIPMCAPTDQVVGGVPVLIPANGDHVRYRNPARPAGRHHPDRQPVQRAAQLLWRPAARRGHPGGPGARWHHPAADPRRGRARGAAAGDLPRLPGAERRARRLAAPAAAGPARTGSTTRRRCSRRPKVRQGKAHSIRVVPGGWLHRLAGHDRDRGEFAAQPGDRPAGTRAWWRRDSPPTARSRRCASSNAPGLRGRHAVAPGIRLGDRCSSPAGSSRRSARRCGPGVRSR